MSTLTSSRFDLVRQARLAQVVTASWMLIELLAAIAAGILARSVALTTFGIDSGIEIFTALVVLRQLSTETHVATEEALSSSERRASRLVGWSLYALIAYIVLSSGWSLITRSQPEASTPGIVLAVAALLVMPLLWRWRLNLAERLDNPALRADAACSAVCIYLALTLLGGLVLNRLFGFWWADPLAALAMLWWVRGEATEALKAARTGRRDDC